MDTSKIIRGVVSNGRYTVTAPIVKEDYGLYLQIEGVELPQTYEVDFSNSEHSGTSVTMIGNADGVLIPHQFIDTGKDIFAFLYHVGEDFGRTVYKFRIPNKVRPDRTDETPTPEEQSTIDQAIGALNTAVEQTAQDVIDADASAQSASQSAENAHDSAVDAQNYAESAQTSANNASASASQASASATASAQSASQSAQIKADVEDLVDDAQSYAESALIASQASVTARNTAHGYAQSASASAQSASTSASDALTYANTASSKASEASTSAQTASQKAAESAQSASQALSYKTDAESAKTASQTAQGLAESARDTAVSAKTDAESARDDAETARDEAQSAVASISGALIEKAPIITDTASGAIASFSDGADNIPLKSLVVDINPIQDLHGQESPYPAGGGKNEVIYPYYSGSSAVINGVTFTVDSNGVITANGLASENAEFILMQPAPVTLAAGDWTISGLPSGGGVSSFVWNIYARDPDNTMVFDRRIGAESYTFNCPNGLKNLYIGLRIISGYNCNNLKVYPQFESGSSATTFAPYSNICPISGWTEVDVEQSGVNVWDEEYQLGFYNANGIFVANTNGYFSSKNKIPVKPSTDYAFCIVGKANQTIYVCFYGKDGAFIKRNGYSMTDGFRSLSIPNDTYYINFSTEAFYGTTYNHDISINYPSTDHDYHPYAGRSINIQLGQTVYGGKLDVLSGELVIDRYFVDPSQWTRYNASNGYIAYRIINIPYGRYVTDTMNMPLSNMIAEFGGFSSSAMSKNIIQPPRSSANTAYMALQNGIDPTTVELSYIMQEPITIQLTPHQVNSLLGVNNIWANSGDSEVVYRADTKLYIQKKIAEAISALS